MQLFCLLKKKIQEKKKTDFTKCNKTQYKKLYDPINYSHLQGLDLITFLTLHITHYIFSN